MKRLYGLRGATQCLNNTQDMCEQIALMYNDLLTLNKLDEKDVVSLIFSVTDDLDVINPCTALRKSGLAADLALFSAREPETKNSLERTVRLLVHCYLEEDSRPLHVYRNGAEVLRPDRVKKKN